MIEHSKNEIGTTAVLRVRAFNKRHEKAGNRKMDDGPLKWVAMPTDLVLSPVLRSIERMDDGPTISMLLFKLILLAARSPVRGEIRDELTGAALSTADIADVTGVPEPIVRTSIGVLTDRRVQLIELAAEPAEVPESTSEVQTSPLYAAFENKTEPTPQDTTKQHTTTNSKARSEEARTKPRPPDDDGGGGDEIAQAEQALASVGVNEPGRWARSAVSPRTAEYAAHRAREAQRQGAKNPAGIAVRVIQSRERPPDNWRSPAERAERRAQAHDEQRVEIEHDRAQAASARLQNERERALIEAHADIADQAVERAMQSMGGGFIRRTLERLSPSERRMSRSVRSDVIREIQRVAGGVRM